MRSRPAHISRDKASTTAGALSPPTKEARIQRASDAFALDKSHSISAAREGPERGKDPSGGQDLAHLRRQRLSLLNAARGAASHDARRQVDLDLVALGKRSSRPRAREDRQADGDGVAQEDAREGVGDHAGHAEGLEVLRGRLAAGATAEVPAGHDHVAWSYLLREAGGDGLERGAPL